MHQRKMLLAKFDRMSSIWLRHSLAISLGLIATVVIVIYGQTAWFDLVTFDDPHYISQNKFVLGGVTKETFVWSFTTTKMEIWHPVTWLSYQLETTIFGAENNAARHIVNMLLHFVNSVLVWLLMRLLGLGKMTALVVALVWAAHPQHVQVVAWISERKELLATGFGLCSMCFYIKWWEEGGKHNYTLSMLAFMFAIASKPTIVPLCLVVLYYSFSHLSGNSIKRVVFATMPFIVLTVTISVITALLKTHGNIEQVLTNDQFAMDVWLWLALIPQGLAHYLVSFAWPWPLPVMINTPAEISPWSLIRDLSIITVFLLLSVFLSNRNKVARFGLIWFMLFWLPVSGVISLGAFYVSDRYMYLPHIGLIMLCVEFSRLLIKSDE